jgi:hypothetical protein
MILMYYIVNFFLTLFLFGRGALSCSKSTGTLFRLQLPLTGPLQKESMTRRQSLGVLTKLLNVRIVIDPPSLSLAPKELFKRILTKMLAQKNLNSTHLEQRWN